MLKSIRSEQAQVNGLVLTGGGARAAFQVGVLAAIADMAENDRKLPFPVVCGASAGSINALLLASRARNFRDAVDHMSALWSHLEVDKVFRADTRTMTKTTAQWLGWLTFLRSQEAPRSLLDNTPLRHMLENHCRFARIQQAIDSGDLHAVSVTAASYTSSRSVSFFQGRHGLVSWSRTRRDGVMCNLDLDHVMASVALPIIFPAVQVGTEYFGDGSMRQASPLSPPINLGASHLLVIGMRNEDLREGGTGEAEYPTFGEIGGYVLDSLFMDSLYTDLERLRRTNELLRQFGRRPRRGLEHLKEIEATVIVPSEDLRAIAQRHLRRLPRTFKTMLRLLGASRQRGTQLASYLLFDGNYCRELIELGYQDAMKHRHILERFLAPAERK